MVDSHLLLVFYIIFFFYNSLYTTLDILQCTHTDLVNTWSIQLLVSIWHTCLYIVRLRSEATQTKNYDFTSHSIAQVVSSIWWVRTGISLLLINQTISHMTRFTESVKHSKFYILFNSQISVLSLVGGKKCCVIIKFGQKGFQSTSVSNKVVYRYWTIYRSMLSILISIT